MCVCYNTVCVLMRTCVFVYGVCVCVCVVDVCVYERGEGGREGGREIEREREREREAGLNFAVFTYQSLYWLMKSSFLVTVLTERSSSTYS